MKMPAPPLPRLASPTLAWPWATLLIGLGALTWGGMAHGATGPSGKTIVMQGAGAAPACQSCHGAAGEGSAVAGFPRLAGLPSAYLQQQLQDFASGQRQNPTMVPIARALSPAERKTVADYFAGLGAPAGASAAAVTPAGAGASQAGAPDEAALGTALALNGRWSESLPACVQCHGPGGRGVGAHFPPLAGQPTAYLVGQLQAWQAGTRPAGPLGLMGAIASKLSTRDMHAVAAHFAALPTTPTTPAIPATPATPARSATAGSAQAARAAGSAASAAHDIVGDAPQADLAAPEPRHAGARTVFEPPAEAAIPGGEIGAVIRAGRRAFTETPQVAGRYIGNSMRCSSCHLDAGRLADSAPLWAAWVSYPAYRSKTRSVNTFADRLRGCFEFSMNGTPPPLGDPVLVALQTYAYWLASGATVSPKLPGRGYPALQPPPQPADFERGRQVFEQHCALCHGAAGAGQRSGGITVFPALWGDDSFNWGAGMGRIDTAAAFIKANMPLSLGGSLTDQQAWDAALYMDSHERPQDPRWLGNAEATRQRFHATAQSMYGRIVAGHRLGATGAPKRRSSP